MRSFILSASRRADRLLVACVVTSLMMTAPHVAYAQAIILSVNGDPVTSIDLEQQMKLLRALRKPATREAAIESMIEDRLKGREASRFGISIKDNEIGEQVQVVAKRMKISPTALMQSIQKSGVSDTHARGYFKAQLGYSVLVRALNRGVEASEIAVRGELQKEKSSRGGVTNYTIRQVVFTLNPDDPPSAVEASVKQAQALRTRFSSCDAGIAYAKTLPGVAVRAKLTRSSEQLSDGIKEVLDKTAIGHLTDPSRSANGVEMVALCDRSTAQNDDDLRKTISDRLLAQHFAQEEAAKYKELRSHAVIRRDQ